MSKPSKFDSILKGRTAEVADVEAPPVAVVAPPPLPSPDPPKRGRPPGKRSDKGYVQTTAYIPGDLHRDVKIALLKEGKGQEFSELVGALLADWLGSRT